MTDIATLGIRVDSSGVDEGTRSLRQLDGAADAAEASVDGLSNSTNRLDRSSRKASRSLQTTGRSMRGSMGMLSMQMQDVIVQAQMGTAASIILAQQGPQIASAFGSVGAIVGVAIGAAALALGPLINAIFGTRNEAEALEEQVADTAEAIELFLTASEAQIGSLDELRDSLEQTSEAYRELGRLQRNTMQGAAERSLAESQTEVFNQIFRDLVRVESQVVESAVAIEQALSEALRVGEDAAQIEAYRDALGDLPPAAQEVAFALSDLETASTGTAEEFAESAVAMATALDAVNESGEFDALISALAALGQAALEMGAAVQQGADTAVSSLSGLGAAFQAANVRSGVESGAIPPQALGDLPMTDAGRALETVLARNRANARRPGGSLYSGESAGGGGGGAGELTAEMRAAEQVIRQAQEAAVEFSDVQEILNEKLRQGAITQEIYNDALERAQEKYSQVGEAAEFWNQQQQALQDGILDAIVNGEDLADTFQNIARSIARAALEAALFGDGPLAGPNIGGGLLGGLFNGLFGRASGGPVTAGQPYIVGERRPELFVPSTSGRIEPTVPGGGNGVTVQVNNYSGQQVETAERKGPDGQRLIEVSVGRAIADGRFDRAMASRYGNTPQRVRR
jgi:hypothetical protein